MTEFNPLDYGAKPKQTDSQTFNPLVYGAKPRESKKPDDSWMELLGKSAATGIKNTLDLPKALAQGTEGVLNRRAKLKGLPSGFSGLKDIWDGTAADKIHIDESVPESNVTSYLPSATGGLNVVKDLTGYEPDLEQRPANGAQRAIGHGVEFLTSVSPFAKGKKALDALKLMGAAGASGTASGVAQELGADPLVSDIIASVGVPWGAGKIKNAIKSSSKEKAKDSASKILQNTVGGKNISQVLENLNKPTPLNANLNTAEMANNPGLARLHQTTSPNISAVAEKNAVNDSLIRNNLEKLSSKTDLTTESAGNQIRNKLSGNLDSYKLHRAEVTAPLYADVEGITQGVPLPKTNAYLQNEVKYAKGEIKNSLDYVQSIIKPNTGKGNSIPAELNNAIKDISGKIGVAKRAGNNEVVRVLQTAKENILKDMSHLPEEALARSTYSQLSKPVSAIENEPLLSQFIKKDKYGESYLMSSEKIPDKILNGSIANIKNLMAQVGTKGKTVETIRGSFVDKLLDISKTSGVNAQAKDGISYHKFNAFMNKNKAKLDLIFTQEQVGVLNEAKSVLRQRNMANTLGKSTGSNTQSDTTLLSELLNPIKDGIIKRSSAKIPFLGAVMEGKKASTEVFNRKVKSLIEEAVVNPDKAKLLLSPSNIIKDSKDMDKLLLAFPILASNKRAETRQEGGDLIQKFNDHIESNKQKPKGQALEKLMQTNAAKKGAQILGANPWK